MKPLVVIGDVLLDRDLNGRVDRLCPDEPAPVFDEAESTTRPGGAALAAVLAATSGCEVKLIAAVGKDAAGQRVRELLAESDVELLEFDQIPRATPEKIRLRQGRRTVLRLDRNCAGSVSGEPGPAAQEALADAGASSRPRRRTSPWCGTRTREGQARCRGCGLSFPMKANFPAVPRESPSRR